MEPNKIRTNPPKLLIGLLLGIFITALGGGAWNTAESKSMEHDKEIDEVKKQIEKNPENAAFWMELGKLYGWDKNTPSAVAAYEKVLQIDPANVAAKKKLVDFYSWNGMPQESAKQAEEILKVEPENLEIMTKLSRRYLTLGEKKKAGEIFRRILQKDPQNIQAKMGLAALNELKFQHNQVIKNYLEILPSVATQKEKIAVYDRVAENYYYARSYGKAREYAKEALRADPNDKDALELLNKLGKRLKARIFTEYRNQKFKGDSHRQLYEVGFNQPREDGSVITGIYKRYVRTAIGEDRYSYNEANFEWSQYYGEGLTVTLGGEIKFYEVDKTRFDYYLGAEKDFMPGLRGYFLYRKKTEDSDLSKLEQRTDRHSISSTFFQDINERLSLATNLEGRYYTKGNAFSDNFSVSGYVSPIIHISKEPILDVAYTYHRIFTGEKDRNAVEQFEYFSPRRFQTHAVTLYWTQELTKNFKIVGSDTVSWVDEPGLELYAQNTLLGEIIWSISGDQRISVRYIKTHNIHNGSETDYKNDELRVQYFIKF